MIIWGFIVDIYINTLRAILLDRDICVYMDTFSGGAIISLRDSFESLSVKNYIIFMWLEYFFRYL